MGLFAFRRLREKEAAANAAASLSMAEPTPTLDLTEPDDGNHNRGHARRGRLECGAQPRELG